MPPTEWITSSRTYRTGRKFVLPVKDRAEWIDPNAPPPPKDPKELPEGHWIVRKKIKPPGPEVNELRTGESHKVIVGRKIAEQLEFDDALFRLMSAVLLPEAQNPDAAPTELDGTRPTAMDLLAASLRYADLHPDRKILITGHTDTSGGDEYNQNLSEFRAAVVYAVLANEEIPPDEKRSRNEFGDLCHGPHLRGKEKKQQVLYDDRVQVLNWIAATFGWPCPTSGEYADYLRAVKAFQSTYNTEGNERHPNERLEVDGDFGPATWRGVFDCYQVHLGDTLKCTAQELEALRSRVRSQFLKPFVGCGENKPMEMVGVDNFRSQTNRRVEVLFFEPNDHVPAVPCLGAECDPEAWPARLRVLGSQPRRLENAIARERNAVLLGSGRRQNGNIDVRQSLPTRTTHHCRRRKRTTCERRRRPYPSCAAPVPAHVVHGVGA